MLLSKCNAGEFAPLEGLQTSALWAHELSGEAVTALKAAQFDRRHDHLNALMQDDDG